MSTPTNANAAESGAAAVNSSPDAKSKDVSVFIANILAQLEEDFSRSSDSIRQALNEMGDKVDNLEQSVYGLVVDAGLDEEDESPHSEIVIIPDVDDDNNGYAAQTQEERLALYQPARALDQTPPLL